MFTATFKASQMGHLMVSLWFASLSTNTGFRVLYFRMNNCSAHMMLNREKDLPNDSGRPLSYIHTLRLHLRACCSQSGLKILKIRQSSAHALLVQLHSEHLTCVWAKCRVHSCAHGVDSFDFWVIVFLIVNNFLKLSKMSYLLHIKTKKFVYVVYELYY